ncbi:hypothetical protein V6N11_009273 [Hibiscus sabdariffa]|uniref:Uncharacterized protein n=1 Tax=Hibiscus sabdariffa TaxID=183260 RepID=A0ABR2PQ58_9ROSI
MEGVCETKLCTTKLESVEFANQNDCLMEIGLGSYGCSHYRRRCKIRAPCCNEIFSCRHCHNEAKNSIESNPLHRHDIPRHEVEKVICSLCDTEQDVQQYCINCGVCMGKYFCAKCKFFDDDVFKSQYHCDECGICRTGGEKNFFHCSKCGCCYSKLMREVHRCVERAMHHNCPVCFEYLFDTMKDVTVLPCGHTMHLACIPVLSAQSLSVICQNCGENSTKRLTQPQCLQHTKIRWYGFYATIVESIQMYSSILWHINARIASRTTRDRHAEAPLLLLRARQECLRW